MKEVFRLLLTASAIAVFSTLSFAAGPSVTPAYHEPSTLVHTRMQPAGASCEAVATSLTPDILSLTTTQPSVATFTATLQPQTPAPTIDQYGVCVYRCLQSNRNVPGKESYCANACAYLLR